MTPSSFALRATADKVGCNPPHRRWAGPGSLATPLDFATAMGFSTGSDMRPLRSFYPSYKMRSRVLIHEVPRRRHGRCDGAWRGLGIGPNLWSIEVSWTTISGRPPAWSLE